MKIYPRLVSIEEGKESYELNIRNSAEDERILLFKIRRSEHKMVDFTPKMGYVEPGQTTKVILRLIDHSIPKTRLLVKLVVMKKSMLEAEFEESWNAASKRNGEVKKVIDMVNMHASGAQDVLGAHTVLAHKRTTAKHHMMLNRIRSTDSDAVSAVSDASALSLQQSATSAGFYSPSVSAMSSPTHSERGTGRSFSIHSPNGENYTAESQYCIEGSPDAHHERPVVHTRQRVSEHIHHQHQQHRYAHAYEHDEETYSVADSVADESVDLNSYSHSESLSQSQQLQLQHATAALLQQETPQQRASIAEHANSGPVEQKALMDALIKLAQTPNTATLLSQLLLTVGQGPGVSAHTSAGQPNSHPPKSPVTRASTQLGIAYHDISVANGNATVEKLSAMSSAEQTSCFIEGEQAEFPSIIETQAKHQALVIHEPSLQDCSRLAVLSSNDQRSRGRGTPSDSADDRGHSLRGAYLLELFGAEVSNQNFANFVEQRMEQATADKGKVVAIEVVSASISDLSATLGRIFAGGKSFMAHVSADPLHQLRTLRAAYLEDNLKHLTVNHCPLHNVDTSINRFRCLTTLNLSNNSIHALSGPLDLPLLRSLDLSGNHLTSLDYLQILVSLTTLLAGGNDITSLNLSVNMLVSLSKCLVTLDLSSNPVCDDQHYAQQVLHALPRLRYFDSFDLQLMGKNYSYAYQRAGSTSRRASSADSKVGGVGGRTRCASTGRQSRLPDLPEEVRSVRFGSSSTLSRADRRREFERRLNTAIGLRQRHPARSVHSPPTPEPVTGKLKDGTHSYCPRSVRKREQNESDGDDDDDDDIEIQSVEDSIHQLSSSLRHGRPATVAGGAEAQEENIRSSLSPNTDTIPLGISITKSLTGSTRRSPSPPLIQRWASAGATQRELLAREALLNVPPIDEQCGLLEPTMSIKNRQAYYGVANRRQRFPHHNPNTSYCTTYSTATLGSSVDWESQARGRSRSRSRSPGCSVNMSANRSQNQLDQHDHLERGYFSEGDLGTNTSSRGRRSGTGARRMSTVTSLNEEQFLQMQEDEKYGIWNPRYRVPKPIFGFSRPFIHRRSPHLKDHAPLFNTTVQRLRDSFRKAPARGTFSRAGKGLPGDWYPMDYSDLEAIRRQGYFHETIGEVTKDSYKDANSNVNKSATADRSFASQSQLLHQQSTSSGVPKFLQEALVSPKGSVSLTPDKKGRRQSWGPHMSRYDPAVSAIHLSDNFSGFRKWHQGLFAGDGELDVATAPDTGDVDRSAYSATGFSAPPPSSSSKEGTGMFTAAARDSHDDDAAVAAKEAVRDVEACFDGEEDGDGEQATVESTAAAASVHKAPSPLRFGNTSYSRQDESVPSPQLGHSPKDLGRAVHGHSSERVVTLLPMEARDSGELRSSSALGAPYSPPSSFTTSSTHPNKQDHPYSQQQSADASFADDLRMFEALPSFPAEIEASLSRFETQVNRNYGDSATANTDAPDAFAVPASKKSAFQAPSPIKPAPPATLYQDMSEQIAAEEAELSNYLSWLENQHRTGPPAAVTVPATAPLPASAVPSSNNISRTGSSGASASKVSTSPSGIPRYSQSPSQQHLRSRQASSQQQGQSTILKLRSSIGQDEVHYSDEARVFSPRDAAMRAEQQERAESEERLFFEQGNNSKSTVAMRSLFR